MANEVLNLIIKLRAKAQKYSQEIAKLLQCQPSELLPGLFNMISNNLTLELELLNFYYTLWSKISQTNRPLIDRAEKQNVERVILIQKMAFISIMSSIEFCFKEYIKQFPHKIGDCENQQGRVYLFGILNKSKDSSIITDATFIGWQGMIELRNTLVHNNGIAEKTESYTYQNCKLILKSGAMITGNLTLFLYLIDQLLDFSKEWILEMNKK
jgi:hypothetical protein